MSPFNVTWLQNFQTRLVTCFIVTENTALLYRGAGSKIQIPMGAFRVMIKHLPNRFLKDHPIKLLNVTIQYHMASKFSNSDSNRE